MVASGPSERDNLKNMLENMFSRTLLIFFFS